MTEQAHATFGRRNAATIADKEPFLQLGLKAADLAAERRLGDVQKCCGPAEAAEFHNMLEIAELSNVHETAAPSMPLWHN